MESLDVVGLPDAVASPASSPCSQTQGSCQVYASHSTNDMTTGIDQPFAYPVLNFSPATPYVTLSHSGVQYCILPTQRWGHCLVEDEEIGFGRVLREKMGLSKPVSPLANCRWCPTTNFRKPARDHKGRGRIFDFEVSCWPASTSALATVHLKGRHQIQQLIDQVLPRGWQL